MNFINIPILKPEVYNVNDTRLFKIDKKK